MQVVKHLNRQEQELKSVKEISVSDFLSYAEKIKSFEKHLNSLIERKDRINIRIDDIKSVDFDRVEIIAANGMRIKPITEKKIFDLLRVEMLQILENELAITEYEINAFMNQFEK